MIPILIVEPYSHAYDGLIEFPKWYGGQCSNRGFGSGGILTGSQSHTNQIESESTENLAQDGVGVVGWGRSIRS